MPAKTLIAISLLTLIFIISGCAPGGDKAPVLTTEDTVSSVRQLMGAPDTYKGETIVLSGSITRACPDDGCFFYLNDGTGSIKVDLKPIESRVSPKKNGAPIIVYGNLVNNGSIPYVNAAKIKLP